MFIFVQVVSLLLLAALCFIAISLSINFAVISILAYRERRGNYLHEQKIRKLQLWCSYDFPILEDVCPFLLEDNYDIDSFREKLRAKYGKRID